MAVTLDLRQTKAFQRDARKASPLLGSRALEESRRLTLAMRAEPMTWMQHFDQFASIDEKVLEVRLTHSDRMFVHVGSGGGVTYFRMGEHNLLSAKPPQEVRKQIKQSLLETLPLPETWRGDRSFALLPDDHLAEGWWQHPADFEVSEEWVHYLSPQQERAGTGIFEDLLEGLGSWNSTHYVLGGPGTGKTTILLWLFLHLAEDRGIEVRLDVSPALAQYVERATGWDLTPFSEPVGEGDEVDILLIDDPSGSDELLRADELQREGSVGHVVVAVDPLQLSHSMTDEAFKNLIESVQAEVHWLTDCYRQKDAVGTAAKHVIDTVAESSPFLREDKKRTFAADRVMLTSQANSIAFVNPGGTVQRYETNLEQNWARYCTWLRQLQEAAALWSYWPAVLVAADPQFLVPRSWLAALGEIEYPQVSIDDIESIKGLEYQHVAVFVGANLRQSIDEGFTGSGQAQYERYRLLRIPFTRARDSLALFVET
jgi:hypothetical protein